MLEIRISSNSFWYCFWEFKADYLLKRNTVKEPVFNQRENGITLFKIWIRQKCNTEETRKLEDNGVKGSLQLLLSKNIKFIFEWVYERTSVRQVPFIDHLSAILWTVGRHSFRFFWLNLKTLIWQSVPGNLRRYDAFLLITFKAFLVIIFYHLKCQVGTYSYCYEP